MKREYSLANKIDVIERMSQAKIQHQRNRLNTQQVDTRSSDCGDSFDSVQFQFGVDSAKIDIKEQLGLTRDMRRSVQMSSGFSKSTGLSHQKRQDQANCSPANPKIAETTKRRNLQSQISLIKRQTQSTQSSKAGKERNSVMTVEDNLPKQSNEATGILKTRQSLFSQTDTPTQAGLESMEIGEMKDIIGNIEHTLENLKSWVKHQEDKEKNDKGLSQKSKRGIMEIIRECNKNPQKDLKNERILKQRQRSIDQLISAAKIGLRLSTPQNNLERASVTSGYGKSETKQQRGVQERARGRLSFQGEKHLSLKQEYISSRSRSGEKSQGSLVSPSRNSFLNPGKSSRNVYIKNLIERQKLNSKLRNEIATQKGTLAQSKSASALNLNHSASLKTSGVGLAGPRIVFGKKYSCQIKNQTDLANQERKTEAFVVLQKNGDPHRFEKIRDLDFQEIGERKVEHSNAKRSLKKLIIQTQRVDAISKDYLTNMFKDVLPQCRKNASGGSLKSNSRSREKAIRAQAEIEYLKEVNLLTTKNHKEEIHPSIRQQPNGILNVSKFELHAKKPPKPSKCKPAVVEEAKVSPLEEESYKKTVKLEFSTLLSQCDVQDSEKHELLQNISTENQRTKMNEITPIITTVTLDYTRSKDQEKNLQPDSLNIAVQESLDVVAGKKQFLKASMKPNESATQRKSAIRSFEAF